AASYRNDDIGFCKIDRRFCFLKRFLGRHADIADCDVHNFDRGASLFRSVAAKGAGLERYEIWRFAPDGHVGVQFAKKDAARQHAPSVFVTVTDAVADDFASESGGNLWRKIADLVSVRHNYVLRIGRLYHLLPSVGVTVRRVRRELFVFGYDDLFEVVLRDLLSERTVFIARNGGRNLQAKVFADILRGRYRLERCFVQNAIFVLYKN